MIKQIKYQNSIRSSEGWPGKTAGRTGGESKIIRIVSSRYIVSKTNFQRVKALGFVLDQG